MILSAGEASCVRWWGRSEAAVAVVAGVVVVVVVVVLENETSVWE